MKIEKNGTQHNGPPKHDGSPPDQQKYFPGIWNQYYATFAVCIAGFGLGASGGWASPMLLVFESEDSPVGPMTNLEISPIETLPAIASLIGTVIFAGVLTRFGRKATGYLGAAISIVGWLFLLSAKYKLQLYIGRFITGLSIIGLSMIGPIYLSEIAYVSIRGSLMTYASFAAHCGSLVSFIVGAICSYRLFTAICMIGPVLFPIAFFWIPESPQFLLLQSRNAEARNALLFYRGGDSSLVDEELKILSNISKHNLRFRVVLKDPGNRRALIIFMFLFTFSTMSGTAVISGYASKIFQNADSALDPNTSAAILQSIKFISSLVAIQLIDRFGRRVLIIFSFASMSICLIILTIYSFIQECGVDVSHLGWLPITSLSTYVASNTIGVGTVTEVIASEMLTPEIKGVAIGFVGIVATLTTLASLQLYAIFIEYVGSSANFLLESVFAVSAIFISWSIVPETKGKTIAEISEILRGTAPHISKKSHVTKL